MHRRSWADHRISLRQALVDDPELNPDLKLTVIGDRVVPGKGRFANSEDFGDAKV